MLDSDILIDAIREYPECVRWLAELEAIPSISGFVVMELVNGCRDKSSLKLALELVSGFQVVWPTPHECMVALGFLSHYRLSHNLGIIDALIAATALEHGTTLCTFNVKHFAAVPGLVTEQPYPRA